MKADAELDELETRNRGLQQDLDRVLALEHEANTKRESLDSQTQSLKEELAAARSRLERAAQIRNTCQRLNSLESKLHPLGAKASKSGASI